MQYMLDRRQILKSGSLAPAVAPFVRIPPNGAEMSQWMAKQVLDLGVYGVVWPLYQAEDQQAALSMDDNDQIVGDIPDILLECGISEILPLDEIFAMEFCEDCGTPLFPDRDAELVHPEMPEDTPTPGTAHFH